ncbi:ABC transporter ATP-binding protein YtrE [Paenibacillus sp. J31TS4]|uniref:ABC transporter ATP-binding protein n=1 Tax=Paenibacillus sp. J31TS4 TaxID=2807195 RepID=UPI001B13D109|nr:ABC transporter ATP-binding protein [Paenibacillus sp. J31TS4]GIP38459.1 ABC transporter ATP-binding protein YtrE [Paenibacillus sp. J31TS4]
MIEVRDLHHEFRIGKKGQEKIVPVLRDIDLSVREGEIVSVLGRSGSGKSTLLNLIAGYIRPTGGRIVVAGTDVTGLNETQWAKFRLNHMGFIFQSFQLIPSMTAFANIELPLILKGVDDKKRAAYVQEAMAMVGMEEFAHFYPSELSGGQQQRVGIARAMVLKPRLILADEPTGSLDSETEETVLQFIRELNQRHNTTFLIITHDREVAAFAHRSVAIHNGSLVAQEVLG